MHRLFSRRVWCSVGKLHLREDWALPSNGCHWSQGQVWSPGPDTCFLRGPREASFGSVEAHGTGSVLLSFIYTKVSFPRLSLFDRAPRQRITRHVVPKVLQRTAAVSASARPSRARSGAPGFTPAEPPPRTMGFSCMYLLCAACRSGRPHLPPQVWAGPWRFSCAVTDGVRNTVFALHSV